jgi:proline iminopeptidase
MTESNWQESASAERRAVMEERLRDLPDEELAKLPPGQAYMERYIRNSPRIWYDPRFDCSPFWEGMEPNTEMLNYVWGTLFRDIDITVGLEKLDRPVFLALGRYDFLVPPPSAWEPLRSNFQDLTIRVFEKSGHTPQYEEAALFDQELLAWMQEKAQSTDTP